MAFYSTLAEGVCRLTLRVVTIVMFFFLPFIGDKCCELRNQLKLLRNQDVTVTSMTGWIKGPSSLVTAFRIRRLPAGALGLMMMLAAALALITDLVVAKFVNTIPWSTRCTFDVGMVADGRVSVSTFPPYSSKAYAMASTAQLSSLDNGGNYGIYTKVVDDFSFQAQDQDTMGSWNCTPTGPVQRYISRNMTDGQIAVDLLKKNLIHDVWYYSNTSNADASTGLSNGTDSWQLFIMSLSAADPGTDFTIKIALDVEDTLNEATSRVESKNLQLYTCELHPNPGFESTVHAILSKINPSHVGSTWIQPIKGNLYDSFADYTVSEYAPARVGWMLNSLIMVAGSNTQTAGTLAGSDYGCMIPVTEVPNVVIVFVALSGLIVVFMAFVALVLAIMVFRAGKKYDQENKGNQLASKDLRESVPNGLVGWMVHAAQEANQTQDRPDVRGLTSWRLTSRDFDNHRLTMVRAGNMKSEPESLQSKVHERKPTSDYGYPTYTQTPTRFTTQKTGYTSVNAEQSH